MKFATLIALFNVNIVHGH